MRPALIIAALLVAGPAAAQGFLTPLGPVAADQRTHLIRVTAITMIAILPVLIGVPVILWHYRRGRKAAYRPDFAFSAPLETAMWGVPVIIVAVLGSWLWHSTHKLDPYLPLGPDPLEVQVIGLDWKWLFLYPKEGVASLSELAIPAGRPVRLTLTTDTVMQSFMVPSLAGQIYAMPGMVTDLNFRADAVGRVTGGNTQFNGEGFAGQTVTVEAMDAADFDAWVGGASAAPVLDAGAYARIARRGTAAEAEAALGLPDTRMRLGQGDLFERVVMRYHGGGPVPAAAQPGAPAYRTGGGQ